MIFAAQFFYGPVAVASYTGRTFLIIRIVFAYNRPLDCKEAILPNRMERTFSWVILAILKGKGRERGGTG